MIRESLLLLAVLLAAPIAAQTPDRRSSAEVLRAARKAIGLAGNETWKHGALVAGTGLLSGIEQRFRGVWIPDGRFLHEFVSELPDTMGFDGERGWNVDWTGMPSWKTAHDLDSDRLYVAALSGFWSHDEFRGRVEVVQDAQAGPTLRLTIGEAVGQLHLRKPSMLPAAYTWTTSGESHRLEFADHREHSGARFPTSVTLGKGEIRITIASCKQASETDAKHCAARQKRPADTRFIGDLPARVSLKRAHSGHLFAKVKVDDRDAVWFFLDSGAGSHCVDAAYAKKIGLAKVGGVPVHGAGGSVSGEVVRAKTLQVGPFVQERPVLVTLDLRGASQALELNIAGIVGYDFFARSLVALDIRNAELEVDRPGAWEERRASWHPLTMRNKHPCVPCKLEGDRSALFRLDTGANGSVTFHSHFVESNRLLDGRETSPLVGEGVGGKIKVREGELAWFEIGGHRFERPRVRFAQARTGAFADRALAGNVGVEFLRPFILLFDYPGGRMGFQRHTR